MAMVPVRGISKIRFPAIISGCPAAANRLCHNLEHTGLCPLNSKRSGSQTVSVEIARAKKPDAARRKVGFCAGKYLLKKWGDLNLLLIMSINFLKQHFTKYKCCQKKESDADRNHDFVQTRIV